jgi:hypothetical protein
MAATGQIAPHDSGLKTAHNPHVIETPGHSFPICLQENCLAYNTKTKIFGGSNKVSNLRK